MNSPARRKTLRRRRQQRGFSLIELGIVIAVIAVLASVVIFGRGFIAAGRITKAVEGMNTIRKSASTFAGLQGGALRNSTTTELATLVNRQLLPALTNGAWEVSGTGLDSIKVTNLRFGQVLINQIPSNAVAITIDAPGVMTQDIWNSVEKDNNIFKNAVSIGQSPPCATAPGTGRVITICFKL